MEQFLVLCEITESPGLLPNRKVQKAAPRAQNSAQSLVICSTGRDLEFALLGLCRVPIVDGPILKSWLAKNIGGGALEPSGGGQKLRKRDSRPKAAFS